MREVMKGFIGILIIIALFILGIIITHANVAYAVELL